jgi:glycerol-3-phosphate dehydrogenase
MIGTTDTAYTGDLDNPLPNQDEIDYLLKVVNSYSREKTLNRGDIIASWAGLRPLVAGEQTESTGKNTSTISREHLIFEGPGGLIGLIGGKLTNYRLMAGQVVDRILGRLTADQSAKFTASKTKRLMLGGWTDNNDFLVKTADIAAKGRRLSIEPATIDHLIASYGKDAQIIVEIVEKEQSLKERICPDFPHIMAEVPFCVLNEMAVSLEDLLFRRMRIGMLHQMQCLEAAPKVSRLMQSLLNWDDARTSLELKAIEKTLNEHLACLAKATV